MCAKISLEIAPTLESYGVENVQLGLEGEHQQINAALAVALCISWACHSPPSDRIHQLQQVTFPSPIGHVLQRSCVLVNGRLLEHSFSICRLESCMCFCNSDAYRNLSCPDLEFTGFCKDLKEMNAWQEVARGGLPDSFLKGLASTKWPGRAEVVHDPSGRLSFYLDGAHSPESMEACANWFCSVVKAEKGGSLKGESNGTHCIEASSDVDDKEWNSRDLLIRRVSSPITTNKDCPSLLVWGFSSEFCTNSSTSKTCQSPGHCRVPITHQALGRGLQQSQTFDPGPLTLKAILTRLELGFAGAFVQLHAKAGPTISAASYHQHLYVYW